MPFILSFVKFVNNFDILFGHAISALKHTNAISVASNSEIAIFESWTCLPVILNSSITNAWTLVLEPPRDVPICCFISDSSASIPDSNGMLMSFVRGTVYVEIA